MKVKLLTEQHLALLHLKRGCTGSYESTHVKMPHCWKSHVRAHLQSEIFSCFQLQEVLMYPLTCAMLGDAG